MTGHIGELHEGSRQAAAALENSKEKFSLPWSRHEKSGLLKSRPLAISWVPNFQK